jgi:signal transduction histidine kinase
VTGLIGTCRDVTEERQRDEQLRLHAQIVQNVQIALAVWCVEDPNDARRMKLLSFNPAAERMLSATLPPLAGKSLREIVPYAAGGRLESLILEVAREGGVRQTVVHGSRDPVRPNRSIAFKAFALPGKCVGTAIEDITAPTLAQRMALAEQRIFEMIAEGAPLGPILTTLAVAIEEQSPPTLASILLLDRDGVHIRHAAGPSLSDDYNRALDGQAIGPKAGSCGTAMYTKRPVIVTDIQVDPLWEDYQDLAQASGVRACWSMPILATDGRVLGTFAMYYQDPRAPSKQDLALIARATHIAGIAIERRQLEEELRALSAHLESALEEERTTIAREIHDVLGQALTALKLDLAWIGRHAADGAETPRNALVDKMAELSATTDEIIDHVRRISSELRPGVLDDLGLLAALEWQAQEFERRSHLTCIIHTNVPEDAPIGAALSTAVYRVFQEALTNVVRHGAAKRVDVRLELSDGWLELDVADDGRGITPSAIDSPRSLGLIGIRERVKRLGGTAIVKGAESHGTVVSVRIPMSGAAS